jgi:hypothetical protein
MVVHENNPAGFAREGFGLDNYGDVPLHVTVDERKNVR